MSHELRTPLNSALILAKLLSDNKDGNLTPEQVKYAATIYSAGNDLLVLINDILDLSRIEAGRMELQVEAVDVPRTIDALKRTFLPVAVQKRLSFEVQIAPGAPVSIASDGLRDPADTAQPAFECVQVHRGGVGVPAGFGRPQ